MNLSAVVAEREMYRLLSGNVVWGLGGPSPTIAGTGIGRLVESNL